VGSCIALHVYSATMLRDIVGQVATLHSDHAAAREDSASPAVWDAVVGEHAILNLHLAAGHVQRTRKVLNKRALVEHEPATAHHHRWSGECLTNLHTLEGDLASGDVDYGRRCGGVRQAPAMARWTQYNVYTRRGGEHHLTRTHRSIKKEAAFGYLIL